VNAAGENAPSAGVSFLNLLAENASASDIRNDLRRQWESLLPGQPTLGHELLARWTEPHRHYHDPRHLAEVLAALPALAPGLDLRLPRLALWFHDAVLTGEPTDEEHSAELAADRLSAVGVPAVDIDEVCRLILVTGHHRPRAGDTAPETVSDADLAVLAALPSRYDESVVDLRRERTGMGLEWHTWRTSVLASRLNGNVFFSAVGAQLLPLAAHANLRRELATLSERPSTSGPLFDGDPGP
jgi:predicted metal-dependent HD superfamily phosphohydrolase